jgi:decaprenylphospho-beta-D-erythro-pentofuranosid-2-ulose 2-reductase
VLRGRRHGADPHRPARILLLGGTSEIGIAILRALAAPPRTEVVLAGRDERRLAATAASLPGQVTTAPFDATAFDSHRDVIESAFRGADLDLIISAAGLLVPQPELDADPPRAAELIGVSFTGHVTALLAAAGRMRRQGHGTIVILSSVAAVRPRRANFVYGSAKAGLDAFARGLADSLRSTGVRVVLVRPGFVTGRMTSGMTPAPLATTPARVGAAVAAAVASGRAVVWVPPALRLLALALRLLPRSAWRRLRR